MPNEKYIFIGADEGARARLWNVIVRDARDIVSPGKIKETGERICGIITV